jgi:hypothetical protein
MTVAEKKTIRSFRCSPTSPQSRITQYYLTIHSRVLYLCDNELVQDNSQLRKPIQFVTKRTFFRPSRLPFLELKAYACTTQPPQHGLLTCAHKHKHLKNWHTQICNSMSMVANGCANRLAYTLLPSINKYDWTTTKWSCQSCHTKCSIGINVYYLIFRATMPRSSLSLKLDPTQPLIPYVPRIKPPRREADCSPPTSAEVSNLWIYTAALPYVFL